MEDENEETKSVRHSENQSPAFPSICNISTNGNINHNAIEATLTNEESDKNVTQDLVSISINQNLPKSAFKNHHYLSGQKIRIGPGDRETEVPETHESEQKQDDASCLESLALNNDKNSSEDNSDCETTFDFFEHTEIIPSSKIPPKPQHHVRFKDPIVEVIPTHVSKYMSYLQLLEEEARQKKLKYRLMSWVRSKATAIVGYSRRIREWFINTPMVSASSSQTDCGIKNGSGSSTSILYKNMTPTMNSVEDTSFSSQRSESSTQDRITKKSSFTTIFCWNKDKQRPNKIAPSTPKKSGSSHELSMNANTVNLGSSPSISALVRKISAHEVNSLFPDNLSS